MLSSFPKADATALIQLEKELTRPLPGGKQVAALAEQARGRLETPVLREDNDLLEILERAVAQTTQPLCWDDVIQRCLALAAWRRALKVGDKPGELAATNAAAVDDFLHRFHEAFPRGYDSPRGAQPGDLNQELATLLKRLRTAK
jgi:hypothetical protein